MKLFLPIAVISLLVSGYAHSKEIYKPTTASTHNMSCREVHKEARTLFPKTNVFGGEAVGVWRVRNAGIAYERYDKHESEKVTATHIYPFQSFGSIQVVWATRGYATLFGPRGFMVEVECGEFQFFFWYEANEKDDAIRMANVLFVLSRCSLLDPAVEAAFQEQARRYREAIEKPALPEAAVKYRVQAEFAVEQKRFDDAEVLYEEALAIAPWWPEGHFNRALILGEGEEYEAAISEMKRYLLLVPNAPDARAAQNKIYQWESVAK